MAENSKIEWTDHTFNPWVGCTKISPACDHCYAEGWAKRTGQADLWKGERRRTSLANWRKPLQWNLNAWSTRKRAKVFCASLADVFDNQVPEQWRADLFALIEATPYLDWQLLTKRPQNIAKMLPDDWGRGYPNVWLGTTVENQEQANLRIQCLLDIPAALHFLSCEPLLGPVDLTYVCIVPKVPGSQRAGIHINALAGKYVESGMAYTGAWDINEQPPPSSGARRIDWVICGGEANSKNSRPMHPDWARLLRDQCVAADAPFFFKQWGEWLPGEIFHPESERGDGLVHWQDGQEEYNGEHIDFTTEVIGGHVPDGCKQAENEQAQRDAQKGKAVPVINMNLAMAAAKDCHRPACRSAGHCKGDDKPWLTVARKVRKGKAGRLLDGREWNEFPEAAS